MTKIKTIICYNLKSSLFTFLLLCISLLLLNCNSDNQNNVYANEQMTLLPSSFTGVTFENHVQESVNRGFTFYEYFYNGSGVAIGDINNDGLEDVFFTGSDADNHLYLNKGNLKFEDISEKAGVKSKNWSTGVTMADINDDGWLDIYICNSGPSDIASDMANELYINNGDNTFTEQAAKYGIDDNSRSTQASFFDMDKDGDLDLWVLNHGQRRRGVGAQEWFDKSDALDKKEYNRECSTLYRNEGNGKFTDISKEAGIQKIGFGLGIAINDFDDNGLLDVYIANDYFIPDFMFLNNGDGTFTNGIETKLSHTSYYAMGCDAADFNNDGLTDLAVLDMTPSDHVRNKVLMASMDVATFDYLAYEKKFTPQYMMNSLCINNGFGIMSDVGLYAGVSQTDWSWAPLFADIDNDGYKDLMVTNGYKKDTKNNDWQIALEKISKAKGADYTAKDYFDHLQKADVNPVPNSIFKNMNGLKFESKVDDWGFSTPSFSNGAAYADLDQDGDLDVVINNFDQPAFVYRNNSRESKNGNYIQFKLKDSSSENTVLHSKLNIYYDGKMQSSDYSFTRGFQSSVGRLVHFGLGDQDKVEKLEIIWPDGKQSTIQNPAINQLHDIDRKKSTPTIKTKEKVIPLFANLSNSYLHPKYKHKENSFNDFRKEILLPHRQSTIGPSVAIGDVNGDGTEDFYIGGAKGQNGALYLQNSSGHFYAQNTNAFEKSAAHEDTGAKFLDIDGDNDLDLYVASGGGGDLEGKEDLLQDRLYINDGIGNFSLDKSRLPKITSSTKAIAEIDWDNDGDLDLFVGGRTTPGKYPIAPSSYLLENNKGTFTNKIKILAPELENIGMVTDADWIDADNDNDMDLIIVGEWMPITLFKNNGKGFENKSRSMGIQNSKGWWSSLLKSDIDQDGDDDFIIGNIGLNNKFHPSEEKPLYIYANDFDGNDQLDIVLSKIYKGQKVPVRGKECSSQQMPFITEKFPTYEGFATASLEDIYEVEQLNNSVQYEANNFASVYLKNNNDGTFEMIELPKEAQLAPINGIVAKDFDNDSIIDLVVGGNLKQTEVETPLYDAGKGLFLKGTKEGKFNTNTQIEYSGLFLHKDVRGLALIHIGPNKRPAFIVSNNNDEIDLVVYRH